MNETIAKMAKEYEEDSFFTHAPFTDEMLGAAQCELGVVLPTQYVDSLKEFGHGGVAGVSIEGVGCDGSLIFVEDTIEYRGLGMPSNLVIVENIDEWVYCIDCDTGHIVSWSQLDGVRDEYDDFDAFVIDEFTEAIANL